MKRGRRASRALSAAFGPAPRQRFKEIDLSREEEQRFWARVERGPEPDSCWIWQGALPPRFVVQRHIGRKRRSVCYMARRVAYALAGGRPPSDWKYVLRRCRNERCICPAHHMEGTHKEKAQLSAARGTLAIGERHGAAKLSRSKVKRMRSLAEQGWS